MNHPAQADEAKGMTDERDLAHEADMRALMRQQLRDNISPEEAEAELAERDALEQDGWDDAYPMGDPDEYDTCHHCNDDGMDPDCDYLLPCPVCQGEQPPPALHPDGGNPR
jgi:hypothetical protein